MQFQLLVQSFKRIELGGHFCWYIYYYGCQTDSTSMIWFFYMDVSENSGSFPPQIIHWKIGFSIISHSSILGAHLYFWKDPHENFTHLFVVAFICWEVGFLFPNIYLFHSPNHIHSGPIWPASYKTVLRFDQNCEGLYFVGRAQRIWRSVSSDQKPLWHFIVLVG